MAEFYDEVERQIDLCKLKENILVLGCGTGLEIERIHSNSNVTAIDVSEEMLNKLKEKKLDENINLSIICGSYFDIEFGLNKYDLILSSFSFHHFNKEQKQFLYKKIYDSLKDSGIFINGDSMSDIIEKEERLLKEAEATYDKHHMEFGSLHIDVPFTWSSEKMVLKYAGFTEISIEKEWRITKLYKAVK